MSQHLPGFPADKVHHVNHHLSHAASAYYTSGWNEALVVILDGMGEAHAVTAYHAHDNQIDKLAEISAKDSIGILYSIITLHLGFDFNSDEYKIMGLAPYGNPARYRHFFEQAVELLGRKDLDFLSAQGRVQRRRQGRQLPVSGRGMGLRAAESAGAGREAGSTQLARTLCDLSTQPLRDSFASAR